MAVIAEILDYISLGIALVALVIIVWGVIQSGTSFFKTRILKHFTRKQDLVFLHGLHHDLGYHLLIALEFLIAADIIRTIIDPTLEELLILGVVVAIRIVLGFFLHREINTSRK